MIFKLAEAVEESWPPLDGHRFLPPNERARIASSLALKYHHQRPFRIKRAPSSISVRPPRGASPAA